MKSHHLADGTFKNNYLDSIEKPFSELFKWRWNRVNPEPLAFPLAENDPSFLKNNRIELLKMFCNTFDKFINFSKLEGF